MFGERRCWASRRRDCCSRWHLHRARSRATEAMAPHAITLSPKAAGVRERYRVPCDAAALDGRCGCRVAPGSTVFAVVRKLCGARPSISGKAKAPTPAIKAQAISSGTSTRRAEANRTHPGLAFSTSLPRSGRPRQGAVERAACTSPFPPSTATPLSTSFPRRREPKQGANYSTWSVDCDVPVQALGVSLAR